MRSIEDYRTIDTESMAWYWLTFLRFFCRFVQLFKTNPNWSHGPESLCEVLRGVKLVALYRDQQFHSLAQWHTFCLHKTQCIPVPFKWPLFSEARFCFQYLVQVQVYTKIRKITFYLLYFNVMISSLLYTYLLTYLFTRVVRKVKNVLSYKDIYW